jgi:hypothetical protein
MARFLARFPARFLARFFARFFAILGEAWLAGRVRALHVAHMRTSSGIGEAH